MKLDITVYMFGDATYFLLKGNCRNKPPFFGYVKRSINRKPSNQDFWYHKHQIECGGIFIKQNNSSNMNP